MTNIKKYVIIKPVFLTPKQESKKVEVLQMLRNKDILELKKRFKKNPAPSLECVVAMWTPTKTKF